MAELQVGLGERSYPIIIESGLLAKVGDYLKMGSFGNRYAVVTDSTVSDLYGERLMKVLADAGLEAHLFSFEAGERNKHLQTVAELASGLASKGIDRYDCIVAFGGGVPGDIAGFLASAYMRGIPFIQIPTTLLSQVDSSVGGKTGVDIPEGKNLVGAFYQPKAVYIDTDLLKTLPKEELLGGLGEVIKYGVIRDEPFFDFLKENREDILALDAELIVEVIYTCCKIKADVVEEDEREGGVRRILNYGHTLGHAIEATSEYTIIHGLAVAIGMVAAAKLSVAKGLLDKGRYDQIVEIISEYEMPVMVPQNLDRDTIKSYLKTDKKVKKGKVHFVLPDSIGSTVITSEVTEEMIDDVISA